MFSFLHSVNEEICVQSIEIMSKGGGSESELKKYKRKEQKWMRKIDGQTDKNKF